MKRRYLVLSMISFRHLGSALEQIHLETETGLKVFLNWETEQKHFSLDFPSLTGITENKI